MSAPSTRPATRPAANPFTARVADPAATAARPPARADTIAIPRSLQIEHEAIHRELVQATEAPGRVGAAARDLAAFLDPHFQREEQIALPPLGLLAPLSRGEYTPAMLAVLPLIDSLRAELPEMLREHTEIHAAAARLEEVASEAGDSVVVQFARQLILHAQTEEQVLYPAALLVGELVRARAEAEGEGEGEGRGDEGLGTEMRRRELPVMPDTGLSNTHR
jgi:hypothetical protein